MPPPPPHFCLYQSNPTQKSTYLAPNTLGGGGLGVSSTEDVSIGSSPCFAFLFGGLLIATLTVWSPIWVPSVPTTDLAASA